MYARRWYILLVFATLELHQCLVWNTFGPIAFAVKFAYGWSDATLAMLLNWYELEQQISNIVKCMYACNRHEQR